METLPATFQEVPDGCFTVTQFHVTETDDGPTVTFVLNMDGADIGVQTFGPNGNEFVELVDGGQQQLQNFLDRHAPEHPDERRMFLFGLVNVCLDEKEMRELLDAAAEQGEWPVRLSDRVPQLQGGVPTFKGTFLEALDAVASNGGGQVWDHRKQKWVSTGISVIG